MFWVTTNTNLDCGGLVRRYFAKVALDSADNLIYKIREFDGVKLVCVCDFSDQFYENNNYIAFYTGYLSGVNVQNRAQTLLESMDYSGDVVRFKKDIGGIFSGFVFHKVLRKFIFFSSQGTPNYCYYATSKADNPNGFISISDKPMFASIGLGRLVKNKNFIRENISCGYSLKNTTLFAHIERVDSYMALVADMNSNHQSLLPLQLPSSIENNPKENKLAENTELFSHYLLEALEPLGEIISKNESQVEIRVSGGKDSRTILAALDTLNVPYTPTIYGMGDDDESRIANQLVQSTKNSQSLIVDSPKYPTTYRGIEKNIDVMLLRMNGLIHVEARQAAYEFPVLGETRNPIILGHAHLQRGGFARTMINDSDDIREIINNFFISPFVRAEINEDNLVLIHEALAQMGHETYLEMLYYINSKYRVARYLESHYLYQKCLGIPYYPLIDQKMMRLLDALPMHDKVSEKMVFRSIASFNKDFAFVPLASKRWRFEAVRDEGYYPGYEDRAPENAKNFPQVPQASNYQKNTIDELNLSDEILDNLLEYIHSHECFDEIASYLTDEGKKVITNKQFLKEQSGLQKKITFDFLWRVFLLCKTWDLSWMEDFNVCEATESPIPDVSVIVPVFNAEEYLPQCFASLDAQVFRNFEVVFINDGSSDSSLALLEEYVSSRGNAVLIRQENCGAGVARNVGLERARGEYVVFIDSDDVFTPMFLQQVHAKAIQETADIVVYGHTLIFEGETTTTYPQVSTLPAYEDKKVISWRDDPENILSICGANALWVCLYRREFLLENDLRSPEAPVSNDWPVSKYALLQAERITWLQEAPYMHVRRLDNNSITAKKRAGAKLGVLQSCEFVLEKAQKLPHYEEIRTALWSLIAHEIWMAIAFYDWSGGPNEEMREFLHRAPDMCRRFGITEKTITELSANTPAVRGVKVLLTRPSQEIENALTVPFVFALYADFLEDVVSAVEAAAKERSRLKLQFSSIDVYTSGDCSKVPQALKSFVEEGWLRICKLPEAMPRSEWFLEAVRRNPESHLVCASADRVDGVQVMLDLFASIMLEYPSAVVSVFTRTFFTSDGSVIEPEYWIETAVLEDGSSKNLWVDTSGYYLIPCGLLDGAAVSNLMATMPQSARNDEEYILNSVLQGCGIPVVSRTRMLSRYSEIGGSGYIKNIDRNVLEWIGANHVATRDDSVHQGYEREEYVALLCEGFERQHENNRYQLREARGRVQDLKGDLARREGVRVEEGKFLTPGVVVFDAPIEELLYARSVREEEELKVAQRHMRALKSKLSETSKSDAVFQCVYQPSSAPSGKWDVEEDRCVEIPASGNNYNHSIIVKAQPEMAYRVTATMLEGNASGAELRLWDSEKQSEVYRRYVPKGETVEFSFATLPDVKNVVLLAYPEAIGQAEGCSATIRVAIQHTAMD